MFRNKEFKRLVIISAIFIFIEVCLMINAGMVSDEEYKVNNCVNIVLMIGIMVAYVLYIVVFTMRRYKKIDNLSEWLFKLEGRDSDNIAEYITELNQLTTHDEFKIDNYIEGELSILQNHIYKVTVNMIELNERLLRDKTYLADTLADMSHQLKTPMTSMMVMSDLLSDGDLPAEKREEFTKNIQNQLERMEWLLTTLLRMSKLDAGTLRLNPAPVEVKNLIDKSVEHLLIPMELKNQTLNITGHESEHGPLNIMVDENWTVEALANIIKNCMEHTPSGGHINISYGENPLYDFIMIEDSGAGISEEDLPHIFKRFYKGKNAAKDSVGIGLAFAKQIVNMENGSIEAASEEGEGTRFLIKIYREQGKVTKL